MERSREFDEVHRALGITGAADVVGVSGLDDALPVSSLAEHAIVALALVLSERAPAVPRDHDTPGCRCTELALTPAGGAGLPGVRILFTDASPGPPSKARLG